MLKRTMLIDLKNTENSWALEQLLIARLSTLGNAVRELDDDNWYQAMISYWHLIYSL